MGKDQYNQCASVASFDGDAAAGSSCRVAPSDLEAAVQRFLGPLHGQWQSKRLGYIDVRPRPGQRAALDVWPVASTLSPCPEGPLARVGLEVAPTSWRVTFEVRDARERTEMELLARHSRRRRVIWESPRNGDSDIWDRRLLESANKAAEWVSAPRIGLAPEVEFGFDRLAADPVCDFNHGLTIALCIATKNRLWQLRRALPLNLIHTWPYRRWARIHVVDLGSTDGTLGFLLSRCRAAIDIGLLSVYTTDQLPWWHASTAKNTSHMVAREDVLVNLDSDNLTGPDFLPDVLARFHEGYTVLQYEDGEGTCGRIACQRSQFCEIRGYDEDSYPMGAQDVDLVLRLRELPGARYRKVRNGQAANQDESCGRWPRKGVLSQAIQNGQKDKVAMCNPEMALRWGQMDTFNRTVFCHRRRLGHIARNLEKEQIGVRAWPAMPPGR